MHTEAIEKREREEKKRRAKLLILCAWREPEHT